MDVKFNLRDGPESMMEIRPITGNIGAEISEIDLRGPLSDTTFDQLDQALCEYKVLAIRDQGGVGPAELERLAARFGTLEASQHNLHKYFPEWPSVKVLETTGEGIFGAVSDTWHTDGSARINTNWTSFLQAVEVPDYGRDTVFADMEAAYEGLSRDTQAFLENLTAVHSWGIQEPDAAPVEHPVIYTDPRTGRKAIYVNRAYTRSIIGMREAESSALLEFLYLQTHTPEYQVRVSWRPGTIVAWDNQRTQHYLVQDRKFRRVMHRAMTLRPF